MKTTLLKLINDYWKFDNDQIPISTWHDKQDLLKAVEELFSKDKMQILVVSHEVSADKIKRILAGIDDSPKVAIIKNDENELPTICKELIKLSNNREFYEMPEISVDEFHRGNNIKDLKNQEKLRRKHSNRR